MTRGSTHIPEAALAPEYRLPIDAGSARVTPGTPVRAGELIGRYRSMNVFATVSGTVGAVKRLPVVNGENTEHVTVVTDVSIQDTADLGNPRCPETPEQLIDLCRDAGLVGMGGSGFPLYVKLAAAWTNNTHTLVVNAMQCEPANACDVALLHHHADEIAEALALIKSLLSLSEVVLALPDTSMPETVDAITPLTAVTQVRYLPTNAASGEERQVIRAVTGLDIPSNRWPTDLRVLCMNLATCHALGLTAAGRQPVRRIVTVDGVNQWVRFGHPAQDLLPGGTSEIYHGGRSGFRIDPRVSVGPTTTALQPLPISVTSACIRCGRCSASCPVNLKPQELYWYGAAGRWDDAGSAALKACVACGACDAVCPSHLPLVETFRAGKADLARKIESAKLAAVAKSRFERRQRRQARATDTESERRAQRLRNRTARRNGPSA